MSQTKAGLSVVRDVFIPLGRARMEGELTLPVGACGVVLFAHGSGSSRHSPRNKFVDPARFLYRYRALRSADPDEVLLTEATLTEIPEEKNESAQGVALPPE